MRTANKIVSGLLIVLACTMTGCSINVIVAPHAVLDASRTDAGTVQQLQLPGADYE
ncbi:hypothetical protein [Pseudomonas phage Eisa9]|uniref:Lipoprotein n=1 Tax=Pseudomonas phage Eisa9 TaxID=2900148 RepID=A0AAE8YKF3_9CAUD|nr:hypothetical protein [Pseudomonas phage Eisa9]